MTTGEIVGAVATIFGGVIGALGAALAVYLTLRGQRREDRERIHGAVVREIIELARVAVGQLDICESIRANLITLPPAKLPQMLKWPIPIIYPAIADKIGLLKSPQHIVAFYMRIGEIATMAQAVADDPKPQSSHVQENDVRLIVEALCDICQFATWIIRDDDVKEAEFREFDNAVTEHILADMGKATRDAAKDSVSGCKAPTFHNVDYRTCCLVSAMWLSRSALRRASKRACELAFTFRLATR